MPNRVLLSLFLVIYSNASRLTFSLVGTPTNCFENNIFATNMEKIGQGEGSLNKKI